MHLLNRGDAKAAMAELDKPVPTGPTDSDDNVKALVIDAATAARLSAESPASRRLGTGAGLLPAGENRNPRRPGALAARRPR